MPPRPSRYVGEFVVKDIANDRQYLADLLWKWDVGDDLTGWVLGGTTPPTIAPDGQIDIFDNTPAAFSNTLAIFTLPTLSLGPCYHIFTCKFTKQIDDTSVDNQHFNAGINTTAVLFSGGLMMMVSNLAGATYLDWTNQGGDLLRSNFFVVLPTAGVEYRMATILGPTTVQCLWEGRKLGEIPTGSSVPGAQINLRPYQNWLSRPFKYIVMGGRHRLNEVTHYRVRDIKVGRLVGVGDV